MIGNVGLLFWSHTVGLTAGFLTVPYLARVLQPDGWGHVLLAQALAAWLLLLIEYAFDLSVTRRLAEARARPDPGPPTLTAAIAAASTARLLLAGAAMALWSLSLLLLPAMRTDWRLPLGALVFSLARGLTPLWYFLGMERVRRAVTIDTAGRVIGSLSVFVLVTRPEHGWRILAAQATTALVVWGLLSAQLHQELPTLRTTPRSLAGGLQVLREGLTLFASRASGALYMQLNTLVIGLVAAPAAVAMFGGAERIVRAGVSLLDPATRVLVPRLSFLHGADPRAAHSLAARLIVGLGLASIGLAAAACVAAPWVIALLLGPGYEAAIPVFRWLIWLLPIIAIATTIGIFSAVPQGHDRIVLFGTVAAGCTNLLLALPLTRRFGAEGMAGSVVMAEAVVAAILIIWYWRQRSRTAPQS